MQARTAIAKPTEEAHAMANQAATKAGTELTEPYKLTPEDCSALDAYYAHKKAPRLKVTEKAGAFNVGVDHPEPAVGELSLMRALGTTDTDFLGVIMKQLVNAGTEGKAHPGEGPNFMLSVMKGVAPKDQIETMLAAQMAAVHMASMTFARRLALVDNIPQQDSASNAFNKLARTFAVQMEALKRYRTGGEQRMTVQHVTVNDGGQAIVGTVSTGQGGGGTVEKPDATP